MILCTGESNAQGASRSDTAEPDAGGWFEFTDRDDVPHRIVVSSGLQPMVPLAELQKVTPSDKALVIEIDPADWPSARFKGRVLNASRQQLPEVHVSFVREKSGQHSTGFLKTDPTGAFDAGPYPPGRWKVEVWDIHLKKPLLVSGEVEVSAGQTFDFGELIVE